MDELYQCPDCATIHSEPWEAALGLFARCGTCLAAAEYQRFEEGRPSEPLAA